MHSQFQSHFTNETSDSTVDTRASQATTAHNSPHNTEPQNISQFSEAVLDSNSNKNVISTSATAHKMRGNSSEYMINTTASEDIRMNNNTDDPKLGEPKSIVQGSETIVDSLDEDNCISTSAPSPIMGKTSSEDNTDLGETESIVQSSEAIMDSQSNEVNISASATSQLMGENSAEDVDQSKDISDRSKLVEPENGHGHHEEAMSGLLGGFDGDQKSEYEHLFSSTCQLLKEASTTLEKDGANKWTSFGNENRQPD
ncbi:hypothetical protein L1049_016601 [Liquidambar formosana]|uniref:Uncharacterized protein n=1 Tax=Liquidambar formosana TaxID=63359 RepID=A0AAP0RZL6_LIQFO